MSDSISTSEFSAELADLFSVIVTYNRRAVALERRLNKFGTLLHWTVERIGPVGSAGVVTKAQIRELLATYRLRMSVVINGRRLTGSQWLSDNFWVDDGDDTVLEQYILDVAARGVANIILHPGQGDVI